MITIQYYNIDDLEYTVEIIKTSVFAAKKIKIKIDNKTIKSIKNYYWNELKFKGKKIVLN